MKKLIRYRLGISQQFPKTHKRAGEETYFVDRILKNGVGFYQFLEWHKIHTIRANYPLWEKRFKKILSGEAVLELYYWSEKPYNSKQVTICQLRKEDGIGIQKIDFEEMMLCAQETSFTYFKNKGKEAYVFRPWINGHLLNVETLAKNDGLSKEDFGEWFKNYNFSEPMAIIHFTNFIY